MELHYLIQENMLNAILIILLFTKFYMLIWMLFILKLITEMLT